MTPAHAVDAVDDRDVANPAGTLVLRTMADR
jgi:hypothetical protein